MTKIVEDSIFEHNEGRFAVNDIRTTPEFSGQYQIVKWADSGWVEVHTFTRSDIDSDLSGYPLNEMATRHAKNWVQDNW